MSRDDIGPMLARLDNAEVATLIRVLADDLLRSAHFDNWGATAIPGFELNSGRQTSTPGASANRSLQLDDILKGLLAGPA